MCDNKTCPACHVCGSCLYRLSSYLHWALNCIVPHLQGLDALSRSKPGNLARPRRFELAAAINRLRTAQLRQVAS